MSLHDPATKCGLYRLADIRGKIRFMEEGIFMSLQTSENSPGSGEKQPPHCISSHVTGKDLICYWSRLGIMQHSDTRGMCGLGREDRKKCTNKVISQMSSCEVSKDANS